ncbi:Peptidyl-prolyl cis-trans isomerase FKBP20-2, chloroplastic [Vitis vinifera]|uniref:peptidylprolyl isomerase n=1 Tax=Vitis vinifera TaxID=29760 RepID=A0A438DA37_VITVI|nr:Peptidyl-prolyl cis-trans isomerase FKBP20-2, chloroplastic [Vitis vinifera]
MHLCFYLQTDIFQLVAQLEAFFSLKKPILHCRSSYNLKDYREQKGCVLPYEENLRRRLLIFFLVSSGCFPTLSSSAKTKSFEVKVVTPENYITSDSGLIYRDFEVGKGDCPKAGQQVTFHYVGYNESGRRIDSSYMQGSPAKIRMGTNALVPGFEEGIRDMKPGGKRRIIILQNLDLQGKPIIATWLSGCFSNSAGASGLSVVHESWEAHNPGWLNALYYPMLVVTAGMVCTPRFRSPWKVQGLSHESFLGYPKERDST